jgi:hypothetical protein
MPYHFEQHLIAEVIALSGAPESGFANLRTVITTVIEEEVERRVEERTQKTLFDLAEGELE